MKFFPMDSVVMGLGDDGLPLYDRPFDSQDQAEVFKRFFSNGVFMEEPDNLQVVQSDGMTVKVMPGYCMVEGRPGSEPETRTMVVQAADETYDRIDTVVVRLDVNREKRAGDLYVVQGSPGPNPVRPTLTRTSSIYEIGLGDLLVQAGQTSIGTAKITDTRMDTARCGIVTPFASIDTTTLYKQLESATQEAVDLAQGAIDGTLAGDLQSQINAANAEIASLREQMGDLKPWETIYPVGAVYISFDKTSPAQLFGGTWEALPHERFLLQTDPTQGYNGGETGGSATHTHSASGLAGFLAVQSVGHAFYRAKTGYFESTDAFQISGYKGNKTAFGYGIETNVSVNNVTTWPPWIRVFMWKRVA